MFCIWSLSMLRRNGYTLVYSECRMVDLLWAGAHERNRLFSPRLPCVIILIMTPHLTLDRESQLSWFIKILRNNLPRLKFWNEAVINQIRGDSDLACFIQLRGQHQRIQPQIH